MAGAIEKGTLKNYRSGLKKFSDFLSSSDLSIVAPSCSSSSDLRMLISQAGVIEAFICFCFQNNLSRGTTGNYIDALKHFATDLDGVPYFPREEVISRLLDGFQKLGKRPSPPKLGIDVILLRRLILHVDSMDVGPDKALWKAMFAVAFFGCFRVSEFLVSEDAMKLLSYNNVRLAGDAIEFLLFKTKNNSSGSVQQVLFAPLPDDIACPVRNLLVFRSARASSDGSAAFFSDSSGIPVSASRFNVMLRKALLGLGISDSKLYSAKSFRVGAASMSYSLNMSVEDIQALGRWASTAFLYYIRAGARAVRACGVQKRLSRVI